MVAKKSSALPLPRHSILAKAQRLRLARLGVRRPRLTQRGPQRLPITHHALPLRHSAHHRRSQRLSIHQDRQQPRLAHHHRLPLHLTRLGQQLRHLAPVTQRLLHSARVNRPPRHSIQVTQRPRHSTHRIQQRPRLTPVTVHQSQRPRHLTLPTIVPTPQRPRIIRIYLTQAIVGVGFGRRIGARRTTCFGMGPKYSLVGHPSASKRLGTTHIAEAR